MNPLLPSFLFLTTCVSVTPVFDHNGHFTSKDLYNVPKYAKLGWAENETEQYGSESFKGGIDFEGQQHQDLARRPIGGTPDRQKRDLEGPSWFWETSSIEYKLKGKDYGRKDRATIAAAFRHIEDRTCVRFTSKRATKSAPFIYIERGNLKTCGSWVGKSPYGGLKQKVFINSECMYIGGIVHELLHRLGFDHEQSRLDRDKFVTVQEDNIEPGQHVNFKKEWDYDKFPYDYKSILHYNEYGFSKNNLRTLIPTKKDALIGQRLAMSETDVMKVNALFECGPNYHGFTKYKKDKARALRALRKKQLPDLTRLPWTECPKNVISTGKCKAWQRLGLCSEPKIAAACASQCTLSTTCENWIKSNYCDDPYKEKEMRKLCFCGCAVIKVLKAIAALATTAAP